MDRVDHIPAWPFINTVVRIPETEIHDQLGVPSSNPGLVHQYFSHPIAFGVMQTLVQEQTG